MVRVVKEPEKAVYSSHYRSFAAFLSDAANEATITGSRSVALISREIASLKGGDDFYATRSFEAAMDLALGGWRKGQSQARNMKAYINKLIGDSPPVRTVSYAPAGHAPNVGRYLTGQPDPMYRYRTREGRRYISLAVSNGALWSVPPEHYHNRAVALLYAITALQSQGYGVSVTVYHAANNIYIGDEYKSMHVTSYKIKQGDQVLDYDRLMFVLGNVDVHRRFVFSVREQVFLKYCDRAMPLPSIIDMGSTCEVTTEDNVYFPSISTNTHDGNDYSTVDNAIDSIIQILSDQGVKIDRKRKGVR